MTKWKIARKLRAKGLLTLLGIGFLSCTADQSEIREVVREEKPKERVQEAPSPVRQAMIPEAPDPCQVYSGSFAQPPFFLPDMSVMLTRLLRTCVTRNGEPGFSKDSEWMAMGFPCTAGGGRVEVKGSSYVNPKMVTFLLGTDCPMSPSSGELQQGLRQGSQLSEQSKFLAFNPFVVQYWEIPGFSDSNVGFTIDLRSNLALAGPWKKLRNNEPVEVHLYGRENAWVSGDNFYFAQVNLKLVSQKMFKLEVVKAKPLSDQEKDAVRARCESQRPSRDCSRVF